MRTVPILAALLLAIPLLSRTPMAQERTERFIPPSSFNFLVIGDWGRMGQLQQQRVANAMGTFNQEFQAQCVISTGDNFYCCGVASVDDPQWITSFERVYRHHSLQIDWYSVLGNHDYRGNPQAEIDYARKSRRWRMLGRYYTVNATTTDGAKILMVFIDTSPLIAAYRRHADEFSDILTQNDNAQLAWLDSTLTHSNARWKVVVGHHPVYSTYTGSGEESDIAVRLRPLIERTGVDLYLCGHEHTLQHQHAAGEHVHYFISGAGSEAWPSDTTAVTKFNAPLPGFLACSITTSAVAIRVIDTDGEELYGTVIKK
jgi:tartrate-resistant acid phosphatase type 5